MSLQPSNRSPKLSISAAAAATESVEKTAGKKIILMSDAALSDQYHFVQLRRQKEETQLLNHSKYAAYNRIHMRLAKDEWQYIAYRKKNGNQLMKLKR